MITITHQTEFTIDGADAETLKKLCRLGFSTVHKHDPKNEAEIVAFVNTVLIEKKESKC